ncbi:MAG: SDR family NAD(P)-dependent oxidoreductase [Desulfobacterales bacterium]|jgi:3-hydroxybutyrate dehydrogenase
MRFKDRVAIVTGGGAGIGRSICVNMAKEGAKVAVMDINEEAALETAEMIKKEDGEALALKMDVTQKADVQAMTAQVLKTHGKIDILVNNAGTDIKGAITELAENTWDTLMNINLKGVFLCTQAAVVSMIEQRYGRIVNISSMAGKTGEPLTSPYCATKFGVIGFTQSIALELGKHNITVNAVCPGPVDTDLIRQSVAQSAKIKGMAPEDFLQEFFINPTPLGRIAQPVDIARAVIFLASDDAEFITGSTLNVSGGREMH